MICNVIVALLLHGGTQITLMLWTPDPDRVYLFYIFAAMWGMGDAVIQTQINGKDLTIHPLLFICSSSILKVSKYTRMNQHETYFI